ncbi:tetratricopeptide repeat protein, partial [Klebsiella aerogenes]|uniref:tetratricopeptide repeat protein n=1 Tax=Klebsiella aerogenes TaxID=548 RepID=UPI0034D18CE3
MNNLGSIYQRNTPNRDPVAARAWLEKAAQAGLPLGMLQFGMMNANGTGGAKDMVEARRWYEKAAAAGNSSALVQLGYLYE